MGEMFDMKARAMRRDRAARMGGDLFLLERAFDDCLERLDVFDRKFASALLLGCPSPSWPTKLRDYAETVEVADPGILFAGQCGGRQIVEDRDALVHGAFDLILSVGTLDTVNGLQAALHGICQALQPDGLFIGAISGGETLPLLRRVMATADRASGHAVPRVHPRIEAAMLAPLLEQAGFVRPVVDIDRVSVGYRSFDRIVADLRAMAATNILEARSRAPLSRSALSAAIGEFEAAKTGERATETFEILHFAAWRA